MWSPGCQFLFHDMPRSEFSRAKGHRNKTCGSVVILKLWAILIASVTEMLSNLKWPTLRNHRKYLRLTLLFKVINHLQTIPEHYLPSLTRLSSTRSNHPCKFSHIQSSCGTYKFSFFPRTIPEWNNLKISNINNLSLDDFKHTLNQYNFM